MDTYYFYEDDAITCPRCGARTNNITFKADYDTDQVEMTEQCINASCGYTFNVEVIEE